MYCVYVLDQRGKPLMPTTRFGKVRRMLKSGQAKAVRTKPFTIQLNYEPETHEVQRVMAGPADPGRTNIGVIAVRGDGKCLFAAECETRNKEIRGLMEERAEHRRASRRGERLRRKRRAKAAHTLMAGRLSYRTLPGCEKTVLVKDIINTESKFNNRKRPDGWITPTVRHLVQTHVNLLRLVCKILPVSDVTMELNRFAFTRMENPGITGKEFQNGPLKGYESVNEAVDNLQDGKCLLCGKPIGAHHHIIPRHLNGSNTIANIAGLCVGCHEALHKDHTGRIDAMLKEKKEGLEKKYGALSALNQAIPFILKEFEELFPGHTHAVRGWHTSQFRKEHGIEKGHAVDAYCAACMVLGCEPADVPEEKDVYHIRQFRRHNRARIKYQHERSYRYVGQTVAKNRKPRTGQGSADNKPGQKQYPALSEWQAKMAEQYGEKTARKMVSHLKVTKSTRGYYNTERITPGAEYLYEKNRFVVKGGHHGYVYPLSGYSDKVLTKNIQVIGQRGLVFI